MRKVLFCCVVLMVSAVAANAAPKAEVFGGYQFTHFDGGPNMNGWNGALTGNFNNWFGVTADFSGVYGSGLNVYTYTFGPGVHANLPLVRPFAHAFFGGARLAGDGGRSSGLAMLFGGGGITGLSTLAYQGILF